MGCESGPWRRNTLLVRDTMFSSRDAEYFVLPVHNTVI